MPGTSTLKKLARETGGNMFKVSRKQPLAKIYDTIQNELRNQYSIGYTANRDSSDPSFRKIKLRTKNKNLKVQTRSGYYRKS